MAIGARSQAAKTYLERHFESFPECSLDALLKHGLKSLAATLQDGELTTANCSIALVGKDTAFTVLEDEAMEPYIQMVKEEEAAAPEPMEDAAAAAPPAEPVDAPVEDLPAAPAAAADADAPPAPEPMETSDI